MPSDPTMLSATINIAITGAKLNSPQQYELTYSLSLGAVSPLQDGSPAVVSGPGPNDFTINAAQNIPVQLSFVLSPAPTGLPSGVTLSFSAIQFADPGAVQVYPQSFVNNESSVLPPQTLNVDGTTYSITQPANSLTVIDANEDSKNSYMYSLIFAGSDGNNYVLDPGFNNANAPWIRHSAAN